MASPLIRTHALGDGLRVRVRLARRADAEAVAALLAGHGLTASDLEVRRLLTYDPASRAVVAATAPIDGTEALVGIAAIDLEPGAEVDTLVADPPVGRLLARVLAERARSRGRRVA